jgi:malonate-semialdehyde dehydrogenase (acetylating)/methylmalonate-semialdehyde dehydrogenase
VSKGVECRTEHFPVGVVASIVPFNFPLMVPNWTMPNALVLGNTMIMKPSELVPLACQRMAELLKEAGLPDGVFNIINGGKEIVRRHLRSRRYRGREFCRLDQGREARLSAKYEFIETLQSLSAVRKIIFSYLPDANPTMTATNVTASMSGCAGQAMYGSVSDAGCR